MASVSRTHRGPFAGKPNSLAQERRFGACQTFKYEKKRGSIAYVTVNRPKVLNAPSIRRHGPICGPHFEDAKGRRFRCTAVHPDRRPGDKGVHRGRRHQRTCACRSLRRGGSPAGSGRGVAWTSSKISANPWSRRSNGFALGGGLRDRNGLPRCGSRPSHAQIRANPRSKLGPCCPAGGGNAAFCHAPGGKRAGALQLILTGENHFRAGGLPASPHQ